MLEVPIRNKHRRVWLIVEEDNGELYYDFTIDPAVAAEMAGHPMYTVYQYGYNKRMKASDFDTQ